MKHKWCSEVEFDEQPYSGVHIKWTIKPTTKITASRYAVYKWSSSWFSSNMKTITDAAEYLNNTVSLLIISGCWTRYRELKPMPVGVVTLSLK